MTVGNIYFIQAGEGGAVKIGYTAGDPMDRLSQLQTGNAARLRFIGSISGTQSDERRIHDELKGRRLGGEWFKPDVVSTLCLLLKEEADRMEKDAEARRRKALKVYAYEVMPEILKYDGPVDEEVIAAAKNAHRAWENLASRMEADFQLGGA